MGTKFYPLHSQDAEELAMLRERLKTLRLLSGLGAATLSKKVGMHIDFIGNLEHGRAASPMLSTLQAWGRAVDVRVEVEVQDLWRFHHMDPEFLTLFRHSRPWEADEAARQFLLASVRQWRVARGMDVEHLAPLLGQSADSVRYWERDVRDPLMARLMAQVRATGSRVRIRTFTREEWFFG